MTHNEFEHSPLIRTVQTVDKSSDLKDEVQSFFYA